MEEVEVAELHTGRVVAHTRLGHTLPEVTVSLEGVCGGAKVGVDGVRATAGLRTLQLDVQAGASCLPTGQRQRLDLVLHAHQLNKHELLGGRRRGHGMVLIVERVAVEWSNNESS